MTTQEFLELLKRPHEHSGLEYKGPGARTNKPFFAKVVRAVLGMANRRDGGFIIIGVEDVSGKINPIGMNDDDLRTWKYDDVADLIGEYSDPSISFELEIQENENRKYVLLIVKEFPDIPIVCKKNYSNNDGREILRKGACYVRSRRKPETTEIPSQEDMRDLLDLAIEKGVRKYVIQSQKAGITTFSRGSELTDSQRFEEELKEFK